MTIGVQDLELIKKEVAGIRDFYQSRMDSEIPPLKGEVDRIATQLDQIQKMWRDGEKRAILAKYGGGDRTRQVPGPERRAVPRYLALNDLALHRLHAEQLARVPAGQGTALVDDEVVREARHLVVLHGREVTKGVGVRQRAVLAEPFL